MTKRSKQPLKTSLNNRIDALFGGENQDATFSKSQNISIDLLKLPEYQPRQYFDSSTIEELAESIKKYGILEPLLVRPSSDGKYEIVAGGRRYRASQHLSLTEIPVVILNLTDSQALEIAILENLQREDLNPMEETEAILHLLSAQLNWERDKVISFLYQLRNNVYGKVSRNVSPKSEMEIVETVFAPLGMTWKSFVETRLPLLKLPTEILFSLKQGQIAYTKAMAIAKLKDEKQRNNLLTEAIKSNLSLREIKERIKQLQAKPESKSPKERIDKLVKDINKVKLWEKEPKKWQKVQGWLSKIESILENE